MFKKGQLVRSTRTGWLHVVEHTYLQPSDFINVRCVSWKTMRPLLCVPADEMVLIGNNYQPLAPGARAKRRYNEMAAKVARGEAGYQPAVKSPLSKSCPKDYGRVPPCLK